MIGTLLYPPPLKVKIRIRGWKKMTHFSLTEKRKRRKEGRKKGGKKQRNERKEEGGEERRKERKEAKKGMKMYFRLKKIISTLTPYPHPPSKYKFG